MRTLVTMILSVFVALHADAAINCKVDVDDVYPAEVKIIRHSRSGEDFFCSGTVIQNCYVLTAAHCLLMKAKSDAETVATDFKIKGGPHSELDLGNVTELHPYPGFRYELGPAKYQAKGVYDIGLMKLSKCVEHSMELAKSPMTSDRKVTVGGYGQTKYNRWTYQADRNLGANEIKSFDEDSICLLGAKIEDDGTTVKNSSQCIPSGQDSGSPFIQDHKIIGVLTENDVSWLADGSTIIKNSCGVNIRNTAVRQFLEDVLSRNTSSPSAGKKSTRARAVQ